MTEIINQIAYFPILGNSLSNRLGLIGLILLIISAVISTGRKKLAIARWFKWHSRLAAVGLTMVTIHALLMILR